MATTRTVHFFNPSPTPPEQMVCPAGSAPDCTGPSVVDDCLCSCNKCYECAPCKEGTDDTTLNCGTSPKQTLGRTVDGLGYCYDCDTCGDGDFDGNVDCAAGEIKSPVGTSKYGRTCYECIPETEDDGEGGTADHPGFCWGCHPCDGAKIAHRNVPNELCGHGHSCLPLGQKLTCDKVSYTIDARVTGIDDGGYLSCSEGELISGASSVSDEGYPATVYGTWRMGEGDFYGRAIVSVTFWDNLCWGFGYSSGWAKATAGSVAGNRVYFPGYYYYIGNPNPGYTNCGRTKTHSVSVGVPMQDGCPVIYDPHPPF